MKKSKALITSLGILSVFLISCGEDVYTPKPTGYFRIELPEKNYLTYQDSCPFIFESPNYSRIAKRKDPQTSCWFNIEYPKCNAVLYCSYKPVQDNIDELFADSRTLVQKHIVKATDIKENRIENDSARVYGLLTEIRGSVASPIQFHLTDSTKHFLRASLYFNNKPNPDSLAPVLEFIQSDIEHMIETFKWKESTAP